MAKTKQKKHLTLDVLDKLHKPYEQRKEVEFQGYIFEVDQVFSDTKFSNMMKDYIKIMDDLKKHNVDFENMLNDLISLNYILVIKHFTTIPIPENASVKELLSILEKLINVGLFEYLWNEVFTEEQKQDLNSKFIKYTKTINEILNKFESEINKGSDDLLKIAEEAEKDA